MIDVLELSVEEFTAAAESLGQPPYRAAQVADWIYRKGVTDVSRMSNLPSSFLADLKLLDSTVAQRFDSEDGAVKLLIKLGDGEHVEAVMIPEERRVTLCLSTQVGCGMRCAFCASGLGGLKRNLTASEILQQVLHLWQAAERRPTHIVFMGMGEPLANYDATVTAIKALIDPLRFGISARHVTVSTVGLPVGIRRLAKEGLPITLALSLHAPNDALRRQFIPAALKFPLEQVLAAAEEFFLARKREITLEYVLLEGVNDTNVCAEALARITRRLRCNVNLIRYNPVVTSAEAGAPTPYRSPSPAAVREFQDHLRRRGVNAHVRKSRGQDAQAACGQLRAQSERPSEPPPSGGQENPGEAHSDEPVQTDEE